MELFKVNLQASNVFSGNQRINIFFYNPPPNPSKRRGLMEFIF